MHIAGWFHKILILEAKQKLKYFQKEFEWGIGIFPAL